MTALNLSLLQANVPSTSGTYTFSVTRDVIIRSAMTDIGALQEGESPTAQEVTDCALKLNMIAKQWMGDTDFAPGLKVWTRKRAVLFMGQSKYTYELGQLGDHWVESTTGLSFPQLYGQTNVATTVNAGATVIPVASVAQLNINDYIGFFINGDIYWTTVTAFNALANPPTVTIAQGLSGPISAGASSYVWNYTKKGIRPLRLVTVTLRDIYANDTPLRTLSVERYESLPTKTSAQNIADPTAVFYESRYKQQQPNGRLFLDVGGAQDVTKYLWCVYLAPVEDFDSPGDAPDYPQEWFRPLVLQLGKDISGMFDCAWTTDLEQNRVEALAIAKQGNPANSDVYFEVDSDDPYGP